MRIPNSRSLAMRDPALAALMGAGDDSFGVEGQSDDDFGYEFGLDLGFGSGGGAAAAAGSGLSNLSKVLSFSNQAQQMGGTANMADFHTTQAAIQAASGNAPAAAGSLQSAQLWAGVQQQQSETRARQRLIEPNGNSTAKIERYTFALNATIDHLGTAQAGLQAQANPQVNLRPQRVVANAPIPGFLIFTQLGVANVNYLVGGQVDAFQFSPLAVGTHLDIPTLSPANQATFTANYTGVTPLEFGSSTGPFPVVLSMTGPATMAA